MGFHTIEKRSFLYSIAYFFVKYWHNHIFYKRVILIHPENVPSEGHLIFTPNHQNALMDALGPLCNIDRQLIFLARSDIFTKPKTASFLYFLKILPVFRIRDGFETLKKNDETFQKTVDVIKAGNGLVILPEGSHEGIHRLRQLKKGFARIAFKTEEEFNFNLNLRIVPIGLFYDDYFSLRSTLVIQFGKPISVSEYYTSFNQNTAFAISNLKNRLTDSLKEIMINIESEKYYHFYNEIRKFRQAQISFKTKGKSDHNEQLFFVQKEIVDALEKVEKINPEQIAEMNDQMLEYTGLLNNEGIDYLTVEKEPQQTFEILLHSLIIIAGIPFFLYGYFNNILPWYLTESLSTKPKDKQFHSSIKFVLSFILFPIFYLLQSIAWAFIFQNFLIVACYAISLPVSAFISWNFSRYFVTIRKRQKLSYLKFNDPALFKRLKKLHNLISTNIIEALNRHNQKI